MVGMQTSNLTQIQELLLHIGSSHDENGSKYAVKRLAELLGVEGGVKWELLTLGPPGSDATWCSTQLLRLWDSGVAKNATPHYVENYCRIFRHLGLCDELVHPRRVRIVHSLLSSGNRTKVSCGLYILNDVAGDRAREYRGTSLSARNGPALILESVDFSLGALGTVGVPPKVTGGKLMNATATDQDGMYARGLWKSQDLAKVPTRVAYVAFWTSMVRTCNARNDAQTLARVLSLRNFMGSTLNYVSRDPWSVQEDVLRVVQGCVLDLDDVVMTPVTKWMALGEGRFLGQLAQIMEQANMRLQEDGEGGEDGENGETNEVTNKADGCGELGTVKRVMTLASELLTRVLCLMGGGEMAVGSGLGTESVGKMHSRDWMDVPYDEEAGVSGIFAVSTIPQRAVKPILALRPAKCHQHARAMHSAFERNPLVAAVYLRDLNQEVDLKKEATFLVNASLLVGAYGALTRHLAHRRSRIRLSNDCSPTRVPFHDIVGLWKAVFPTNGVSKAVLSKGLQHSHPLVAHATVLILNSMLEALEQLVAWMREDEDKNTNRRGDSIAMVLNHSKRHLPGVQLVIGYHAKIAFDGIRGDVPSQTLSGILKLLKGWSKLFPDAFIEENLQLERMLLHDRVRLLHPSNRLQVVRVLLRGDDVLDQRGTSSCGKGVLTSTVVGSSIFGLDVVLKLALLESSPDSEMYQTCMALAERYISGTKLISEGQECSKASNWRVTAWTRHACCHGVATDAVVDFFIEALKMTIKKPMAYIDFAEAWSQRGGYEYISPLLACSIEKMCRILKSQAKDDLYKAAIVRFVRGVLEDTVAASSRPERYSMMLKHMMDTEFPGIADVGVGPVKGQSKSKRQRWSRELSDAVRLALVDATGVSDDSITQWMVQQYEIGLLKADNDTDDDTVSCKEEDVVEGGKYVKKTRLNDEPGGVSDVIGGTYGVFELIQALENAKKAPSKYHRRLQLAAMVPRLEALLAERLLEGELQALCNAFVGPILQYFGSKDVQVPDDAGSGDSALFLALRGLSTDTVIRLINSRSGDGSNSSEGADAVESSIIKLAEPLLLVKVGRKDRSFCNASALDKLKVLRAVVVCLASSTSSRQSGPTLALARFSCRAAISAIPFIRGGDSGGQPAMDLIDSLGDIISDFGEAARGLEEFERMVDAWSTTFVPFAMGGSSHSIELTRCLRRFSASLIPDDDGAAFIVGQERRTAAIYSDVCSLFLELITKDFVQDTLRCDEPPRVPAAYLSCRMPLESLVTCAARGTMTRNSFAYRRSEATSKSRHKIEMCELLETVLEIIALLERDSPGEVVEGFASSFDKAESVLLQYLMATYGASLSQADMATWSLIRVINERLWRRRVSRESNEPKTSLHQLTGDADEMMMMALIHGPLASDLNYAWGFHDKSKIPLEGLQPLRCAMTVLDFPEWRHLVEVDRLPDSAEQSDAPPEHLMSYEASGYDPAYFLPMCLFSLRNHENEATLQLLIDSTALSLVLRCLGSADICIRAAAYECLALVDRICPPLFEEGRRDVSRIRLLLDWVRQSTIVPFHRFPSVHAVFAAEVSHALYQPASDAYPIATKHLCKYAAMDFSRIIMVGSKGSQHGWLHRLLICGLRCSSDAYLYTKAHVFELNMVLASSRQQRNRDMAALLLHQAGSIPKAARVMTESCGALGWLSQAIIEERERCDREDSISLLRLLERAWKHMISWRGIVERGTERFRASARLDLAIAQARLDKRKM